MISFPVAFIIFLFTSAISGLIGWHARNLLGLPSLLEKKLTAELVATNNKLKNYQLDVHHHFEKTADLFNQMLRQSKVLHEYLLTSSKELCHPEATITSSNIVNTDPLNWQEIVIKSYTNKNTNISTDHNAETATLDHNWHPTFFEARDASDLKTPNKKDALTDHDFNDPDLTEQYYNDDPESNNTDTSKINNKKTDLIES